ncbi:MAG: hypothetical protein ACYS8Y_13820 [Planctomycetota bacterium]
MTTNNDQPTTNVIKTKPNKAKVKIGKMNISIATIKDYDNEQRSTHNERNKNKAKQSQS